MEYNDMLKRIREIEKDLGIVPLPNKYIDSVQDRKDYLAWLLADGGPYSVTPYI